jgi:hypothetical protein
VDVPLGLAPPPTNKLASDDESAMNSSEVFVLSAKIVAQLPRTPYRRSSGIRLAGGPNGPGPPTRWGLSRGLMRALAG